MIITALVLLGLCFGSFVNALVWRMHEQSKPKSKRKAKDSELSITKGRSMCVNCGHSLSAKDLLPVISWVSLGGKCRYCKKQISWQYPVVEIVAAGLFVVAYVFWPVQLSQNAFYWAQFGVWLVAIIVGLALAVYDFKWMLLPNRLVSILGGLGILYSVSRIVSSTSNWTLISIGFATVVSGGLFWALYQISAGKWIGGGDVKMGFVLGLFLGRPDSALMMLFTASLLGTLYAGILMLSRKYKKNMRVPFGPFLLLGTYLVVLFEQPVLNYYTKLILL